MTIKTQLKPHILIVEDNEDLAFLLYVSLQRFGLETICVENGLLFLQHMDQHSSHCLLVFMDCEMPVLDGYQATQKWRDIEHQQNRQSIPIIALTAHAGELQKQRIQQAGMNDMLTKPCAPELLQHTLDQWIKPVSLPKPTHTYADRKSPPIPLLDIDRLQQLNRNDLEILIQLFSSICPKRQKALNQAWHSENFESIRFAAHSFKSSAISIGACELGEACFLIEESNRNQLDLNQQNLDNLLHLIQPSINALHQYLSDI